MNRPLCVTRSDEIAYFFRTIAENSPCRTVDESPLTLAPVVTPATLATRTSMVCVPAASGSDSDISQVAHPVVVAAGTEMRRNAPAGVRFPSTVITTSTTDGNEIDADCTPPSVAT